MQAVKFCSKVTTNGRITLGEEVMVALDLNKGDFVQLLVNPKGPEVKIQKVMPCKI